MSVVVPSGGTGGKRNEAPLLSTGTSAMGLVICSASVAEATVHAPLVHE
jgi:hypothetical protein